MSNTKLTIPCQWNLEIIKKIFNNSMNKDIQITEMYGALSNGITPQGRELFVAHLGEKKEAMQIKEYLDSKGIEFAYLINTPFKLEQYKMIDEELDWIIHEFRANSITVSSMDLIKYIRKKYPYVKLNISTIAGVKNIKDIEKFLPFYPNKIIPHHDLNRNFKDLEEVVVFLKEKNIDFEIMVNESCLRRCHSREQHYVTLGKGGGDREFHKKCNMLKVTNPYQILMANFIRPEDVILYEHLGINLFKVTGRSKPLEWLEEVVQAYTNREYFGNLLRLLGTDPLLEAESKIYLENKALEGFLSEYPRNTESDEVQYCENWILKLYNEKKFFINNIPADTYFHEDKLRLKLQTSLYEKMEVGI